MQERLELIARGEVQWVGYRSAVQALARQGGITGTVENLPDGAVRIVCEGAAGALRGFRDGVRLREDYINVREIETVAEGEATGEFEYFRIVLGELLEELKGSYDGGLRQLEDRLRRQVAARPGAAAADGDRRSDPCRSGSN